jgi:hypothetical protein
MRRTLTIAALAATLLAGTAIAQSPAPAPPTDALPQRSVKITAEQGYIIKENVKDQHVEPVPANTGIEIGGKAPANIELHDFPSLVKEKVPAMKTYKFFLHETQVVIVDPKDNTIADIIK